MERATERTEKYSVDSVTRSIYAVKNWIGYLLNRSGANGCSERLAVLPVTVSATN
jgi:hypothetical protein